EILFTPPDSFKRNVANVLEHIPWKEISNVPTENRAASVETSGVRYCEQIPSKEYENQKSSGIEFHLLALLDGIVSNENLSVEERKKQLKKFKKTYPEVYEKRFPSPKLRSSKPATPSLINRLKRLNFKQ
ncbi:hypothetical protein AB6A40_011576, partial [Gnathostoma spinigerum]